MGFLTGTAKKEKSAGDGYFDFTLLFIVMLLVVFGLIMIYSTSSYTASINLGDSLYYLKRQAIFAFAGLILMVIAIFVPMKVFDRFSPILFILMILIQGYVLLYGQATNGQARWIYFGSIGVQPSEISKLVIILFLSVIIANSSKGLMRKGSILKIFIMAALLIGPVILADLSTGIIMAGITFIMLYVASRRTMPFIALIALAIIAFLLLLKIAPYRLSRIEAWTNVETSENAYQIRQALYAVGSGGFFGKGLGQSIQKLDFIPYAHNDMIFSVICEELGVFGGICLIALYVILIWRCMVIANNAPDLKSALVVTGIMTHIGLQAFINIAVSLNFIPNTGVTLPFISYGGTSVMFLLI
ncbi:MAG: cell division protein FtsW, partial [Lachnospiraceae bacterium]|nr:cell division protein FtsW [Lachnospiraceae bacterium]